ncbi:cysteine synthase [Caloramator quimbayensis]|uniref:Cysteine synthase n=1 Tax=Caloramator quimbayensis TaxID=1147123 RepID=A0A1T4YHW4_9CLOT|nr:cysteine synthase A [Caloramator quimbayensis]SKB01369.1 cysteine synthase [Caloramator quimbayensis]
MIYNKIFETIGDTPIIRLQNLLSNEMAQVYVKLEYFNPGGSIKDRIALSMIEDAEKKGLLKSGGTIIEPTSGNTGIGIAMIGASKGYRVIIVMPETMSIERRKLIKAFGAEIILTEGSKGMRGAVEMAEKLSAENGYFMPLQFNNKSNPLAHMETTAKEILKQTEGKLDMFVCGVGTGGTITGVGRVLKREIPNIKIVAVEPKDSPVLSGGKAGPHKIQGIGAGFIPEILDMYIIDEIVTVSNEEAIETARKAAKLEGLLLGISSGAAICAAIKKAKDIGKDKKVLTIAPDTGERYLSTELFNLE